MWPILVLVISFDCLVATLTFNNISGVFRGGYDVLVRAKLALADGVTMQLTVRASDQDVAELVTSAVG